jgi:hypothetical protein
MQELVQVVELLENPYAGFSYMSRRTVRVPREVCQVWVFDILFICLWQILTWPEVAQACLKGGGWDGAESLAYGNLEGSQNVNMSRTHAAEECRMLILELLKNRDTRAVQALFG